jgi:hypothetical protein
MRVAVDDGDEDECAGGLRQRLGLGLGLRLRRRRRDVVGRPAAGRDEQDERET